MPSFQEYLKFNRLNKSQFVDSNGTNLQAADRTHFGRKIAFDPATQQRFIGTKRDFKSAVEKAFGEPMAFYLFVRANMSDKWLTSGKPLLGREIDQVDSLSWSEEFRLMQQSYSAAVARTGLGLTNDPSNMRGIAIKLGFPSFSDSDAKMADSLFLRAVNQHPDFRPGITLTPNVLTDIGRRVVTDVHNKKELTKYAALNLSGLANDVIAYIFHLMAALRPGSR